MSQDPRSALDNAPMGAMQVVAVVLCVVLNALDGFDVLAISFASPGIATEWGIEKKALGIVLSMELVGMAFGSALLGNVADRLGRRPTILACLAVMTLGMLAAAVAGNVWVLSAIRLVTGLGIGGMLASINAMAAEYSNARRRDVAVAIMAAGYPLGVIAGGSIASLLLRDYTWRSVFLFGAGFTALLIVPVWLLLPESIAWLLMKQPRDALARVNATLARLGHAVIAALPPPPPPTARKGFAGLFSAEHARATVLLTVAYFAHIMTFYFIIKWIPKLVVDMGYAPATAAGVLVWANVGGASGAILLGLLAQRYRVRALVILAMLLGSAMVVAFGRIGTELDRLTLVAAMGGFFINGAIVGLYAIFAQVFPVALRAGGTGFVVGVGRGGAALGPVIAGFLFDAGIGLPMVAAAMAAGSLIAAGVLWQLRYEARSG